MAVYSASLKGMRDQNEDKHYRMLNMNKKDPSLANINLYGIFDGHGGKFVSEFLEKTLPNFFMNKNMVYPLNKPIVSKIYAHIQNVLKKEYKKESTHCGSTALLVAQFKKEESHYLNIINLGDCRAVLCRDNIGIPLTKDHKPNWPEERTRITQMGGQVKKDSEGEWRIETLSVSRAFGDLDCGEFVSHLPDVYRYKLDKSDKFMVLACDGLWDVMTNQDVVNFIIDLCYDETLLNRKNKQMNIAKMLAEYAIKIGSGDNVSIIVLFFK